MRPSEQKKVNTGASGCGRLKRASYQHREVVVRTVETAGGDTPIGHMANLLHWDRTDRSIAERTYAGLAT
jgi:hypothetical protein